MFVRRNRKGEVVVTGSVLHSAVPKSEPEPEKPRKRAPAKKSAPVAEPAPVKRVEPKLEPAVRKFGGTAVHVTKEVGDAGDTTHP